MKEHSPLRLLKSLSQKLLFSLLSLTLLLGTTALPSLAYDAVGEVKPEITLENNGRQVTYYDIYGGQMEGRADTSDETQFYMDMIANQDNLLHWANLAYVIMESNRKAYWDHAGDGWDRDFGQGEYIYFIDDLLKSRTVDGHNGMKSTGISIANSLAEVQKRAANDIANQIDRKVKGNDFLKRHKLEQLTDTNQPVIYTTVSCLDRYGKTPQFGYNSFTLAFYDFQLHVLDDGEELNTVTGDMSLEEAKASKTPGFSYSTETTGDGLISLNQNNSYDDSSVTVSLSKSVAETTSSSITNSSDFSFGQKIGAEATASGKIPLIAEVGFKLAGELNFAQAIGTAYSNESSITQTQDKSTSVTMNLPAHTVATALQNNSVTKMTTTYDCPVSLTYKVAIFSMCGTMYDDNMLVQSFSTTGYEQRSFITIFGNYNSNSDAVENLYQRADKNLSNTSYEATYGETLGTNDDGDTWCNQLNWSQILAQDIPNSDNSFTLRAGSELINNLDSRYPMSLTGASTSVSQEGVNTELSTPMPLYPIKYIYVKYQLDRDFEMEIGDSLPIYSYRVEAFDQDMVPYYGFVSANGEWKMVDKNGSPADSPVAQMTYDPLTHQQCIKATAEGITYTKYFINEDTYVDYQGRVSSNDTLTSPAYKIVVSKAQETPFDGTIALSGEVTAYVDGEPLNLNALDTIMAIAYDKSGKEVSVPLAWESQELASRGISVSSDGVLSVSKAGLFHVRAYCQEVYSDWVEVKALPPQELIISIKENIAQNPVVEKLNLTFDSETMMSRGGFILLLYKLAGSPDSNSEPLFTDIDQESVYNLALNWAKEHNYIAGNANGSYWPENGLTKYQMGAIIYNIAKEHGLVTPLDEEQIAQILGQYPDGSQVPDWCREAAAYALANGYLEIDPAEEINGNDYVDKTEGAEAMTEIAEEADLMPDQPEAELIEEEVILETEETVDLPVANQ